MSLPRNADSGRVIECHGGLTDAIYHGLATGLCPSCGEFVALISNGHTIRHYAPNEQVGDRP